VAIRSEPELRAELAAVLQEVLPSLASERPVREAMDLIVSHVARLASFEFCGVLLPDATGEHVRLSGAYAFPADYAKRLGNLFEELPVADDALAGAPTRRAFEQGRTVVVPDVLEDEAFAPWRPLAREYRYRSMVSVPLRVRGRVIGVLNGYSAEPRQYTAAQLDVVETLAGQAAVAVSLAALVDDQQATIAQLRELNQQLERQRWVLERTQEIHHRLTAAVIEGSGFERVARTLSDLIERPVAVWDSRAHLICASDQASAAELEPLFKRPEVLRLLREQVSPERASLLSGGRIAEGLPRTVVAEIRVSGELLGYVTVTGVGREVSDLDLRAVEQAATVFALEIVKERVARDTEERLRSDFLLDLLNARYELEERIEERARHHGLDARDEYRVLLLDLDDWDGYQRRRGLSVAGATSLRDRLLVLARDVVRRAWPGCLVHVGVEGLVAACPTAGRAGAAARLATTVEEVSRRAARTAPELTISAGIGRATETPAQFAESYQGAGQCLRLLRALGRQGRSLAVDDLGVVRLLLNTRDAGELATFARRTLGPVLGYDSHAGRGLLHTLDCYLESGADLKATAMRMSVHVNTVKYRLGRVESLCGISLRDPNDLVAATVASVVVRLLANPEGARRASPSSANHLVGARRASPSSANQRSEGER
jgi:sugar diacid utilization regulator/GAF domain-containing protein